jgi:hypothetical protein
MFAAERGSGSTCSYRLPMSRSMMRPCQWQSRGNTMSTHTIDEAARQDARHLMKSALLRMAATAALSVFFALIHLAAPSDHGQGLAAPAVNDAPSAVTRQAAAPADSFDHRAGADAHARRN